MATALTAIEHARRTKAVRPYRLSVVVGSVVMVGLLAASPVTAGNGWSEPERLNGLSQAPSMVLDGNDKIHAAIAGEDGIFYVTNISGVWAKTRATTGLDREPSLAIDGAGNLWIAYERHGDNGGNPTYPRAIRIAYKPAGGTTWSDTKVTETIARDSSPSIDVRAGRLHVSFSRHRSGIWYATRLKDATTWALSQAVSDTRIDNRPNSDKAETTTSLAVTSDGRPIIAYPRFGPDSTPGYVAIRLLRRAADGTWRTTTLTNGYDYRPKLEVDHDDRLHLIFERNVNVWYITNRGQQAGFTAPQQVEVAAASTGNLAIDSAGKVHLALDSQVGVDYHTNKSGAWTRVGLSEGTAYNADIAIGTDGKARVMFTRNDDMPAYATYYTAKE